MSESRRRRLERLEICRKPQKGALPMVVPDDTHADELALLRTRMRAQGVEVLTLAEFVSGCA